jgi:hypothetical protein
MVQSDFILFIIKLVLGGITAFLAILLWSKTRDAAWMSLVAGAVTSYAGIVYDMMVEFGIIIPGGISVAGIPLATMLFSVIPGCFFILAFILMLQRTR